MRHLFYLSAAMPSQEKAAPHTALVIEYEIQLKDAVMQGENCQFTLRNTDHGGDFQIPMQVGVGSQTIFVQLIPGRYALRKMYCYGNLWFDYNDEKPTIISVPTGKISHAGQLKFYQEEEREILRWNWKTLLPTELVSWSRKSLNKKDRERVANTYSPD